LTKQESAENTLKCHLSLEESSKIGLDVINLAEDNVAALCNKQVFAEQEPKLKVAHVVKKWLRREANLELLHRTSIIWNRRTQRKSH